MTIFFSHLSRQNLLILRVFLSVPAAGLHCCSGTAVEWENDVRLSSRIWAPGKSTPLNTTDTPARLSRLHFDSETVPVRQSMQICPQHHMTNTFDLFFKPVHVSYKKIQEEKKFRNNITSNETFSSDGQDIAKSIHNWFFKDCKKCFFIAHLDINSLPTSAPWHSG